MTSFHPIVVWFLMSLAAYRATRLVTADSILDKPRAWLEARGGKLADLITCPWCFGAYASAAVVALTDWQTSVPLVALQVPAVMAAVGYISGYER